jgi:hypothetical protein
LKDKKFTLHFFSRTALPAGLPSRCGNARSAEAAGETEVLENNRCANKGYKGREAIGETLKKIIQKRLKEKLRSLRITGVPIKAAGETEVPKNNRCANKG